MRAIVTGISGQDGFYMARLLTGRGCAVLGLTSGDPGRTAADLARDGLENIKVAAFDYGAQGRFSDVVSSFEPDLVFNFAAKATGQGMFDAPFEMSRINGGLVLDILEAIRSSPRAGHIRFCQASSAEMYGRVNVCPQDEDVPFMPRSPYGAAKLYGHQLVDIYRRTYGLKCASAILYNHESIRRSERFVTRKIAKGAADIKKGRARELQLGDLSASRDWGYAPEYVEAMYLMATAEVPEDYVVATGRLNTIEYLCQIAFDQVDLDYRQFVRSGAADFRVADSINLCGNPARIRDRLGWQAHVPVEDVMKEMVDHEMRD